MRIGLIAGSGQFPLIFARKARQSGYRVFAAAHLNETDPGLAAEVDGVEWVHLGQINRIIKYLKRNHVTEAVMMGGIQKTRMFSDVKPDIKAIAVMMAMRHTHDDGLLRAFAGVLEKEGIKVKASTFLLPEILAPPGCWTKRRPNRAEEKDMAFGWPLAKAIGRLDIGQCIVVAGGTVVAVEAVEGTDAAIRRAGALCRSGAVVIKTAKPGQDMRFDVPAIGLTTIATMQAAGATALAVEACRAVVFDREEMIEAADRSGITIVALDMEKGSDG